jgi:hypothetical protein
MNRKVLILISALLFLPLLAGCFSLPFEDTYVAPSEYDTETLRYNANFKVKVAEGVNWVPANTLGKPNITAEEIEALDGDPEQLKENLNTLYDVIQYIQVADFRSAHDNIRIDEDGISWEHHKPGEMAIITNEGCCATISNLMNFLLEGDYGEVGFIAYLQSDGSGHVFNYIKYNNLYYFIDLTHYRNDFMCTAVEDGTLASYYDSDFIAGNVHETVKIEDYVKYYRDNSNDPSELWSLYMAKNCLPIGSVNDGILLEMVYPESSKGRVKIVYDDPNDNIQYSFKKGPTKYPVVWEPYNTEW